MRSSTSPGALAQGRNVQRDDAQPVVQVLTEGVLLDEKAQVLVRCGSDADVGPDGLRPSHPLELLLLEDAQDLGLRVGAHVSDLVQEDCSLVCQLELPFPLRDGIRESSLLVAEQLAFQEGLGDCGAVHLDERLCRPGPCLMDQGGNELLARAALPGDQDGSRCRCRFLRGLEDLQHPGIPCHDAAARLLVVRLRRGELMDLVEEPPEVGRFLVEIDRAVLHGQHRVVDAGMTRKDDHLDVRVGSTEDLQKVDPPDAGHTDVEDDEVHARARQDGRCLARIAGRDCAKSFLREDFRKGEAELFLVVNDQDLVVHGGPRVEQAFPPSIARPGTKSPPGRAQPCGWLTGPGERKMERALFDGFSSRVDVVLGEHP